MKWYSKVEEYVKKIYIEAGKEQSIPHFLRTVYWIKRLRADADEALLIAGVAHDIERSSRGKTIWDEIKEKGFLEEEVLTDHMANSAKVIGKFLEKEGAPKGLVKRVKGLVSHHEIGGDYDQNLLMDADSISFFENNAERFFARYSKIQGKAKIKEKFDWMFNRISSEERKGIVRTMYEQAIKMLEES